MRYEAYCITNRLNGKKYIGITTKDPAKRWSEHQSLSNRKGNPRSKALHQALAKHGVDNFSFDIMACASDKSSLCELERILISQYNTFAADGQGYNLTLGGEGPNGLLVSEGTRLRLSVAGKGRKHSLQHVAKRAASHIGRKRSPETCAKIRGAKSGKPLSEAQAKHLADMHAAARGRKRDPDCIERGAAKRRGRVVSEEQRRRQSEVMRGRKQSPEVIAKRAAASRGKKRPRTPEHTAKIAAVLRGRKLSPERVEMCRLAMLGRKHSEKTRAKIRIAQIGKPRKRRVNHPAQAELPL